MGALQAGRRPAARAAPRFLSLPVPTVPVELTYSRDDYTEAAIDRSGGEVEEMISFGDPCHYRMMTRRPFGVGYVELCVLLSGFMVQICDVDFDEPHLFSMSAPNMLRVRVSSNGDGEYALPSGDMIDLSGPGAAFVVEPGDVQPAHAGMTGRDRSVHVYVHAEALRLLFTNGGEELPAVIQAFLAGDLRQTVGRRLSLVPGLLRCLEDLHGCTLDGHFRRLFIQSKAIEILCYAFDALVQEEGQDSAEASSFAARGALEAQRLLKDNFVSPPSLQDLADMVRMSRSGLCAAFRQVFGQTVYDYVNDLRMQRALSLLNQRDASITQIAYDVGFNHPSSFSVAVQRRFGTTPSELRRLALADG